jgi:tetratricopeptide (TPR) repeat protein
MSNFDTYYQILQLTPPVTIDQLKRAYRRLAKTCHPDTLKFQEDERAKADFLQIAEAYEILKSQISSPQATPPERATFQTQKTDPTFYYSLGVFYAEIEDYKQAIAEFTAAIRLDPQFNELPRRKQRGIRIKKDLIDRFGVASGILFLVLLRISLSFPHPHAFPLYLHNIHHSKILLPIIAFLLADIS